MILLGINIDHCATLRQARYRAAAGNMEGAVEPDPVAFALASEQAGADGITVHLREDRRHIQDRDVWKLRESIKTRLNLEMANTSEMVTIAPRLRPSTVCIVRETPQEVTTEGGLKVADDVQQLTETRQRMNDAGVEVSLFIDPDSRQVEASA